MHKRYASIGINGSCWAARAAKKMQGNVLNENRASDRRAYFLPPPIAAKVTIHIPSPSWETEMIANPIVAEMLLIVTA